jgi:hypothetical protein
MKTRICSLPLVILITILFGDIRLNAQELAHTSLLPFFDKLPISPVFPVSSTLTADKPETFEDHSDLDALQKQLQPVLGINRQEGAQASNEMLQEEAKRNAAAQLTVKDESPEIQHAYTLLHDALKNMQEMKIEYAANFQRLEDVYFKKITDYYKEGHTQANNANVIGATHDKVNGEEYLLSVYLSHVKELFKQVDNLLAENNYGDGAKSQEVKMMFQGAEKDEALLLNDVIERIKLERITISNCARLAQAGKK